LNFDLFFLTFSPEKLKHELPTYLYDDYYLNDIEYLFNFALTNNYTYRTLSANLNDTVPDYNTVFMWSEEYELGKNVVLEHYFSEQEEVKKETNNQNKFYTEDNLALLEKYVESMPDTQFVFHYSPYSILYWKNIYEMDLLDEYKAEIEKVFRFTSQYDNIKMYFWSDDEMFDIIGDLDNYRDAAHFGAHISKKILQRIDVGMGLLSKEEAVWKMDLDCYFEYLENYDYAKIFE
jgi:hypothetical protein